MKSPIKVNSEILMYPLSKTKTIQIIKSGWDNYYHVIIEDGEFLNCVHKIMKIDAIEKEYNIKI
jgi:hypothetical protein